MSVSAHALTLTYWAQASVSGIVRTLAYRTEFQAYLYGDLDSSQGKQALLLEKVERGEKGIESGKGLFDWSIRDREGPRSRRDQEFVRRLRERQDYGTF